MSIEMRPGSIEDVPSVGDVWIARWMSSLGIKGMSWGGVREGKGSKEASNDSKWGLEAGSGSGAEGWTTGGLVLAGVEKGQGSMGGVSSGQAWATGGGSTG